MPARAAHACPQCGKLFLEQALQPHGLQEDSPQGDGCWEGEPCQKRRTYYRYRELTSQRKLSLR